MLDHIERLLVLFDLQRQGDSTISSYSNGQLKKIALCSVLVTQAPILILDEPFTGGLDPSGILALKHVLKRLADDKDVTILMATPCRNWWNRLPHRVAVLREGRIVACDTPDGLKRQTTCDGSLQDVLGQMMHPERWNMSIAILRVARHDKTATS